MVHHRNFQRDAAMTGRARSHPGQTGGLAGPGAERTVSLALQGGGAHGAFTWGVLDALLEDGRLAENVLDTLDPSMLDFLLATSISERICGELASLLAGVPDGQAMLDQVEERDLFLRRADEQWFRYYPLFREFLRHRLGREAPARVAELHRTASAWFAESRMVSEAVDHALAAGDEQRAVEIVENDGIHLVANSQMGDADRVGGEAAFGGRAVASPATAGAGVGQHHPAPDRGRGKRVGTDGIDAGDVRPAR